MSRPTDNCRESMRRVADLMVEDIMGASDEEVLKDFAAAGGDPDHLASEMRQMLDSTVLKLNKSRLAAARAGAAASRQLSAGRGISNIADARRRLHTILSRPDVPTNLTLAARNEGELSDADVLGMLEDLEELGFLSEGDEN